MKLLIEIPYAGASCDYLYARIRCRRASLAGGGLLRGVNKDPQQALLAEYRWVYRQLDAGLRRKLLPVFEYFELRLLVIALRCLAAGERATLQRQLEQSLFRPEVVSSVTQASRVIDAISRLEQLFGEDYSAFSGLEKCYLRQGPGGLEQQLIGGQLNASLEQAKEPKVREFLRFLLDMRNLLALHKHLRWQLPLAPPLLAGGTLDLAMLEKIWQQGERRGLRSQLQLFARQPLPPEGAGIEEYLHRALTDRLRSKGRDPLQLWLLIDYLWRCQETAREHGLQQHLNLAEKAVVNARGG